MPASKTQYWSFLLDQESSSSCSASYLKKEDAEINQTAQPESCLDHSQSCW